MTAVVVRYCVIEEERHRKFGNWWHDGWVVWDTTYQPPGHDVVTMLRDMSRAEVESTMRERGFVCESNEECEKRYSEGRS